MRKLTSIFLSIVILLSVASVSVSADYIPNPQTAYATEFIEKCQGQIWFLNEVERLLNLQEKTVDTITSKDDFNRITALGFQGGEIEGFIPSAIGELTNLEELFLANNKLSGDIPSELFTLSKLKNIDLSNNEYSGAVPFEFGNMQSVEVLLLWNNHFSGQIPAELGNMANLKNLDLAENELSGVIPESLGNLSNLEVLALSNNDFDSEIPQSFGNLSSLQVLLAWNCGLKGEIPVEIVNAVNLQIFDVADNSLAGEFPEDIGNLVNLIKLSIRNNKISGNIPSSVGSLTKLSIFDATVNELTGIIPEEVGGMVETTLFDISNNKIEGEIPSTVSAMTKLEEFILNDNKLLGKIPDVFANMDNLKTAYFSNNTLVGDAPDSLYDKQNSGTDVNVAHNYMAGENLKGMANQEDNFVEQQTNLQHKIYLPEWIYIGLNSQGNIYTLFKNYSAITNRVSDKIKLLVERYRFEIVGGDETAVEITSDSEGYYVKPIAEIKKDSPIVVKVTLIGNEGVASSEARVKITTEKKSSGGGGGGGGSIVPKPDVYTHEPFIKGYEDSTVRPDNEITREELAMIMYRIIDDPSKDAMVFKNDPFPDVQRNRWSGFAVSYVKSQKIIEGDPDGTYRPEDNLTRAEFATMIARFMQLDANENSAFADTQGHWADKYINAVNNAGYMIGYEDETFKPEAYITRAEVMTAINRILGRKPDLDDILEKSKNPYSDITTSHWAYDQVLEATILHNCTISNELEVWNK